MYDPPNLRIAFLIEVPETTTCPTTSLLHSLTHSRTPTLSNPLFFSITHPLNHSRHSHHLPLDMHIAYFPVRFFAFSLALCCCWSDGWNALRHRCPECRSHANSSRHVGAGAQPHDRLSPQPHKSPILHGRNLCGTWRHLSCSFHYSWLVNTSTWREPVWWAAVGEMNRKEILVPWSQLSPFVWGSDLGSDVWI